MQLRGIHFLRQKGHGRYHFKDRLNFCYYARGSLNETKSRLLKAVRRGLIMTEYTAIKPIIEVLPKKLNAYINSLERHKKMNTQYYPIVRGMGKLNFYLDK